MKPLRYGSFVVFCVVIALWWTADPQAYPQCQYLGCGPNNALAGSRCNDIDAGINCERFYHEVCEGYCDDKNGVDYGNSSCHSGGGDNSGTCLCYDDYQCSEIDMCTGGGGWWDPDADPHCQSPLLINLDNNSSNYRLTSALDGVMFDLDANGHPDRVAWTPGGEHIAFVVLDRNGNGRIDDGSELFGNATPLQNGHIAGNGFDALHDLDDRPSDRQINRADAIYPRLRLWIDTNHNGMSEPAELFTLQEKGLVAIFTDYHETQRRDTNGNWYRFSGKALIDRNGIEVPRHVFDVYFARMPRPTH